MPAGAAGAKPPKRALSTGSQTVLLVEDESMVRELVASVLQSGGYTVIKARHSTEALYFNGEFDGPVHLLLTDLCMSPHLNGRRLAELVRISRPGIPVLYMSGYVDDEEVFREVQNDKALFLSKPFSPDALLTTVRRALSRLAPAT